MDADDVPKVEVVLRGERSSLGEHERPEDQGGDRREEEKGEQQTATLRPAFVADLTPGNLLLEIPPPLPVDQVVRWRKGGGPLFGFTTESFGKGFHFSDPAFDLAFGLFEAREIGIIRIIVSAGHDAHLRRYTSRATPPSVMTGRLKARPFLNWRVNSPLTMRRDRPPWKIAPQREREKWSAACEYSSSA